MKRRFVKCIFAVLLIAGIISSLFLPAFSTGSINRTVRVGYFQFEGYHETDDNGLRSGYGYEFLQKLGIYNNWKYEYVGYDENWQTMLNMLSSGQIDLLTSAQKTPEREMLFDFSSFPIGTSSTILTTKYGSSKYYSGDYGNYSGMRIGMIEGNSRNADLAEFAAEKGFTYIPVYFNSTQELTAELEKGELVDAIVTSNLRKIGNETILDEFAPSPFYAIVRKGDKELLDEVDNAIEEMDLNTPGWRTELFNRYYQADNPDVSLSLSEREYIEQLKNEGKLFKAIVNPDRKPYSYFENGVAKGIIVDSFKKVANEIGIQYEIIETKSREDYLQKLLSGEADLWLDAPYNYSNAESKNYRLSASYITASISRLSCKNKTTGNNTIAAIENSNLANEFSQSLFIDGSIQYYKSISECIAAVADGKAECTYFYTYSAQQIMSEDARNRFEISILSDCNLKFSVGVSDNIDCRLVSIINKSFECVSGSFYQQTVEKYTDVKSNDNSFTAILYRYPLAIAISILAFCILLLFVGISHIRLRSEKKQRIQEMELERFVGYVCKVNESVLEVNMNDLSFKRYCISMDGKLSISDETYNEADKNGRNEIRELFDYFKVNDVDGLINGDGENYFEYLSKDALGNDCWYSYTIQTIPKSKNHPNNFILFKQDINAVKQEEEHKRQVLKDALETAKTASNAKGDFLSRMSHEIRTPLNAIIGYISLAKMADNDLDKINHCLDNSELAVKHLLNIINDVLDMSSIESGKIKIASESFDIKALLTTVSTIFYNQAKEKGLNFSVPVNELTDEWIVGDQLRVNQVLMNLLSNAVKFTPVGGSITLIVTQMKSTNDKINIKFEVKDTGVGISKEYMSRLFTPFEQESSSTARKFGGSGLGLSITKNLVNMMGGSIEVQSVKNEGSVFTVLLPFERSNQNTNVSAGDKKYSNLNALIVDDEQNECDYMTSLLARCGVNSDMALSGEEAIEKIKKREITKNHYDLCIMDWNMQNLDGIETARIIRNECKLNMPIIIATAYDISGIEAKANEVGVSKIVSKPLFQSTMFDLIVSTYGKYNIDIKSGDSVADFTGVRVLLAEDNDMNLEIAMGLLGKTGMIIDSAKNGQIAVDKFQNSENGYYKAILMDIQMPVMDGYEATKIIRSSQHAQAKSIPIIAMTANAFSEDIAKSLACGMNSHVSKPIDYNKLFEVLVELLGKETES